MDNAYKSLDLYDVLVHKRNRIQVKKLNLGDYIEFLIQFDVMIRQEMLKEHYPNLYRKGLYESALNDCVRLATGKSFKDVKFKRTIAHFALEFNRPDIKLEADEKKAVNPDYFQEIIHFIAYHYKWSKTEIKSCYPEELLIYMKKINKELFEQYKMKELDKRDIRFYIEQGNVTKEGARLFLENYNSDRKSIIELTMDKKPEHDLEAFKKAEKEWLKSKGVNK